MSGNPLTLREAYYLLLSGLLDKRDKAVIEFAALPSESGSKLAGTAQSVTELQTEIDAVRAAIQQLDPESRPDEPLP